MLLNFWRRSLTEKLLFFVAYPALGVANLIILLVPFDRLSKRFGNLVSGDANNLRLTDLQRQKARKIRWAVTRAARLTPWPSKCFAQAIVAHFLLQNARLPSRMFFGAAIGEKVEGDADFAAHAWVKSYDVFVTGAAGHENYAITARFDARDRS